DQDFNIPEKVLNLSTSRWIKKNGKLFQKLLCEGYKYTKDLSHYLDNVSLIDLDKYDLAVPKNNTDEAIVITSSCISQFCRELAKAEVGFEQIYIYAKLSEITQASNKIQKRQLEQ
ncbi:2377_t:CDS:2, partial [Cetraspora pellucida]